MTGHARRMRRRWAPLHAVSLLILLTLACLPITPVQAASGVSGSLVSALERSAPAANPHVLELATRALRCVQRRMPVRTLSVIDYSLPSTQRRLWVFDLTQKRLLFREWVAHGRNTGNNMAKHFSNRPGSLMSSLGTFVTDGTYVGHNGLSLRLKGLDGRFNDEAERRAIVIHGADYVSPNFAKNSGRLGRMVFAYYPNKAWLQGSHLLHGCGPSGDEDGLAATTTARSATTSR